MTRELLIHLDEDDWRSLHEAMARRETYPLPDGESCHEGALIAEIARGYLELLEMRGAAEPLTVERVALWLGIPAETVRRLKGA